MTQPALGGSASSVFILSLCPRSREFQAGVWVVRLQKPTQMKSKPSLSRANIRISFLPFQSPSSLIVTPWRSQPGHHHLHFLTEKNRAQGGGVMCPEFTVLLGEEPGGALNSCLPAMCCKVWQGVLGADRESEFSSKPSQACPRAALGNQKGSFRSSIY